MLWILGILAIIIGIVLAVVRPVYRSVAFGLIAVGIVLVILHLFVGGAITVPAALAFA